jgi:hypothetical protein
MDKQFWLDLAELIDAYRLMPRAILIASLGFAGWYIYEISIWYMAIPAADRTMEATGLASITIPAVFGLAGKMVDWYLKTGRSWSKKDSE